MKKLTILAISMTCFSISTSMAQLKINQYGAIYGGAYTQTDIDSHTTSDIPGLYLYGHSDHEAIVCKPGSAGYGIRIDGVGAAGIISTTCSPDAYVFRATTSSQLIFSVDGAGKVSACNYITIIPKSSLKNATETKQIVSPLQKIMNLNGVLYPVASDSRENRLKSISADTARFEPLATNKYKIGLRAEDLESVVPEVVYTNSKGETGVAYNELVGLLVEAIKELKTNELSMQTKIEDMQAKIDEMEAPAGLTAGQTPEAITLHQNIPNPFNQETRIGFNIPREVANAQLFIYNLQGNQLKTITIAERGKNHVTIQASEFTPGMYIYTLIADGKEVASKRMILTK